MSVQRTGYIDAIRARFRDNPIVSLVGPRQAGKTTLARTLAETSTEPAHFFDLESPADLARLSNPELVLGPLTGLVILDEIQRMPGLIPVLRVLADRKPAPARLLIMGSASPALMKEGSESLAGRVSFIDVTGFSLKELDAGDLSRLWWRGGFPRAYLARNDTVARQWHEDFRRTFLERDIPQLGIQVPAATRWPTWARQRRSDTSSRGFRGSCINHTPRHREPSLRSRAGFAKDLFVTPCKVQVLRSAQDDNTLLRSKSARIPQPLRNAAERRRKNVLH